MCEFRNLFLIYYSKGFRKKSIRIQIYFSGCKILDHFCK